MEPAAGGFVVLGSIMLLFPVTGAAAAVVGYFALRHGIDWRKWRLAIAVSLTPYALALLVSGSHVVEVLAAEIFTFTPALLSPLVLGVLLLGAFLRASTGATRRN